jgi:hypothetical protein
LSTRSHGKITSSHQTTKQVAEKTKPAKQETEKTTKQLKRLGETRDLTDESVEYAIDLTLCANGVDRKVYHDQCLIGPQIQKLLANRVTILSQLETNFVHVREQTLQKDPRANLASVEEIKQEVAFVFGLLCRTGTIVSTKERTELQGAIGVLKSLWLTQRIGEQGSISVSKVAQPVV